MKADEHSVQEIHQGLSLPKKITRCMLYSIRMARWIHESLHSAGRSRGGIILWPNKTQQELVLIQAFVKTVILADFQNERGLTTPSVFPSCYHISVTPCYTPVQSSHGTRVDVSLSIEKNPSSLPTWCQTGHVTVSLVAFSLE